MAKLGALAGILLMVACVNSMVLHQSPRIIRNINSSKAGSDDVTQLQTPTLIETLISLDKLSVQEVRAQFGDPATFALKKLKEVSQDLADLPRDQETIDLRIRSRTLSYIRHINRLGFLLGSNMQPEESRRLSLNDITIYISKLNPSKFRGLLFSSNEGSDMIAIPQSVTFPTDVTNVISVSYTVSGLANCMAGRNSTVGGDVIATSLLDTDGRDLELTFSDPVRVSLKLGDIPADRQPRCSHLKGR